jgi:hypothetical protein
LECESVEWSVVGVWSGVELEFWCVRVWSGGVGVVECGGVRV